ncbi:MAG: hypothetical protein ABF876_05140 [Acetobacter aceti]
MAKVICTLPNASTRINGVTFTPDRNQMVSEEISDDVAAHFAVINGYKLMKNKAVPPPPPPADTKGGKGEGGDTKAAAPADPAKATAS